MRLLRAVLCLVITTGLAPASPFSDLGSPLQEVRTHAAELICNDHLYRATPRAPWDEMISTLKKGDSAEIFVTRLQKKGLLRDFTATDFAHPGVWRIRLDDSWVLLCTMNDSQLTEYKIVEEPKEIQVEPPSNYSGFWRTYRINGKLACLYDYQNGRNLGNTLHMSP